MQGVNLLQVTLKENNTASGPKVPHPAERIQPSDWSTDREGGGVRDIMYMYSSSNCSNSSGQYPVATSDPSG